MGVHYCSSPILLRQSLPESEDHIFLAKLEVPSDPPVYTPHRAGVIVTCRGHFTCFVGARPRTSVIMIVKQVLLTAETSLWSLKILL